MVNEKKSKKEDLKKLHRVLDDLSLENIDNDDRKFLLSLSKRIEENYGPVYLYKEDKRKTDLTEVKPKSHNLNPTVNVHHDNIKIYSKKKQSETQLEKKIKSEDLIEIEKIESAPPEFSEIRPKEKEEKFEEELLKPKESSEMFEKKQGLSEWEAVEVEEKETVFYCPHCGSKIEGKHKFCPECGKKTFLEELEEDIEKEEEWEKVELDEDIEEEPEEVTKDKIKKEPKKHAKKETKEEPVEKEKSEIEEKISKSEKKEEETVDKTEEEKEVKSPIESEKVKEKSSNDPWDDVFSDLDYVDNKIGKILYENGITSLEILRDTKVKKLKKMHGIRGRLAKKIKSEVDKLFEEEKESLDSELDNVEESEWIAVENEGFNVDDYTLYEKETVTKKGNKRKVRFFSKEKPDEGKPINLPEGYEVKRNKRTNVPYLRKKK